MSLKIKTLNLLILLILSGCAAIEDGRIKPPLVYRIDIQQGNVIEQSMVNKLKVGMDEKQVRFILGTPLLIDPFHPERWEYLYYYQESTKKPEQRHITVFFKDKKLSHLAGDIKVTHIPVEDTARTEKSVVVPDEYNEKGLLDRWLSDKPEVAEKEIEDAEVSETETGKDELVEQAEEVVTETKEETVIAAEIETEEEINNEDDEPGFFSRMWEKIKPGDDESSEGSEVLDPELENK